MDYEAIVAPTINELFESRIQDMILSGKLRVGDKLPTERELSTKMKISKTAVHLGIKNLERQGFLRVVPRHGVYVANYPETGNLETLIALLKYNGNRMDKKTVASILQFREANEGMAVRLLASNHTTDNILKLRMYIEEIKKAGNRTPPATPDEIAQLLFQYHLYIGLKSNNNVIPMVMNGFHDVSVAFWKLLLAWFDLERVTAFLEDFTALIAKGNSDGAMTLYREFASQFMERIYDEDTMIV